MKQPKHRRRKVFITLGSDGGDTCEIGSRSAEERSVIYNKEVQSEEPEYVRTWRWEVRFRNDAADKVSIVLGPLDDGFRGRCMSIVRSWHIERGVTIEWGRDKGMLVLPPSKTLPTDVERKMLWLKRQVRPTVQYLRERGFGDTILESLGFSSPLAAPGFIWGDGI